jgi:type I restriction enzyme M protein
MSEQQKRKLENQLMAVANVLRGRMNADEYKDYILGFIFYKYLSEKLHAHANGLLSSEDIEDKDYINLKDDEFITEIRDDALLELGYFLKPNELFEALLNKGNNRQQDGDNFILDELQTVLNSIEQSTSGTDSEDDFNALFQDIDLASVKLGKTPNDRNETIVAVLTKLGEIDFLMDEVEADVLGDAYEFMISEFAAGAGKKAGEFYTPQQVSKILAKIVTTGKEKLKSVYDPTCGSGSLLLRVAKQADVAEFFGQERNPSTYNLARMNMLLHDVHYSRFDIKQDDTLDSPQHLGKQFDAVVANPPFSAKWKGKENPLFSNDERFEQYGRLAPSSKADFAFVQHMIHHLKDDGLMACVLPHGVLFRGAAEGEIRKYLIQELNFLDAVIGLPANIFYGTSIPTCIIVIKKNRKYEDPVLFIDASGDAHYIKEKTQNVLRAEDVNLIVDTYQNKNEIEKFSHLAKMDEIKENDFNLNIPRYVDTFEEEEPIDLKQVSEDLKKVAEALEVTDKEIASFCQELNIQTPF